jgi:demethylmenaquinone methyltransferase / 2-methoxy-6-polyprenyl-1,4-benzoquinol methylase
VTHSDGERRLEPHPFLPGYYARENERSAFVRRLFDDTAPYYDRINQLFSFGAGARYRRQCLVAAGLRPGLRLVDVAVGTGLVAREAVAVLKRESDVIGIDLSYAMLAVARAQLSIPLIQGTAEQLPLAAETADFLTMGYALRHMSDLLGAFREFHRVLRPGGTLLLLEIAAPSRRLNRIALSWYLGRLVPRIGRWVTGQRMVETLVHYYWETIANCVPACAIIEAMRESGFAAIDCRTDFDLLRSYIGRKS